MAKKDPAEMDFNELIGELVEQLSKQSEPFPNEAEARAYYKKLASENPVMSYYTTVLNEPQERSFINPDRQNAEALIFNVVNAKARDKFPTELGDAYGVEMHLVYTKPETSFTIHKTQAEYDARIAAVAANDTYKDTTGAV